MSRVERNKIIIMDKIPDNKQIEEKAIELFNSGFNCSQSVLSAYSENLKLDNETALKVASGFGAGMGRLQSTCGAVTGAYMVFGVYCGNKFINNGERKEKSYAMIQDFNSRFVEKHNTTDCKTLLKVDLTTEEGQKQFRDNNLLDTVCRKCIRDSIELINEQISK